MNLNEVNRRIFPSTPTPIDPDLRNAIDDISDMMLDRSATDRNRMLTLLISCFADNDAAIAHARCMLAN